MDIVGAKRLANKVNLLTWSVTKAVCFSHAHLRHSERYFENMIIDWIFMVSIFIYIFL